MNRISRSSSTPWIAAAVLALATAAVAQPASPGGDPDPGLRGAGWMMQARHGGGMMHAGPGMHMRGRAMRGGMIDHLLAAGDDIKLTDAQRDKLRQIRRGTPAALMPKRQAVVEAQMDLHDVMDKDKADAAELRRAHDKVLKARNDLAAAMFDLRVQVREVLTPEQRKQLHERQPAGRNVIRQRMRMHAPGGPGGGFFDGDDADEDDDGGEF